MVPVAVAEKGVELLEGRQPAVVEACWVAWLLVGQQVSHLGLVDDEGHAGVGVEYASVDVEEQKSGPVLLPVRNLKHSL